MRRMLLTSAAVIGLAVAMPAFAQQAGSNQSVGNTGGSTAGAQTGIGGVGDTTAGAAADLGERGDTTAGGLQDNEAAAQASQETPVMDRPDAQMNEADTASQAAADRMMDSGSTTTEQSVNSYSYMSQNPTYSDRLAGTTIGGGYAAEELLGANVVDQSGRTIGTIDDLLVADGQAQLAIVDLGVGSSTGTQYTAIAVDALQPSQGAEGDFVTSLSDSEIHQLQPYQRRSDGSWEQANLQ